MPLPAKGCRRWAVPDRCLRRETATEGVMAACAAEEDTAEAQWGLCRAVGSTTTMKRRHDTNGPCKYGILKGACSEHVEKIRGGVPRQPVRVYPPLPPAAATGDAMAIYATG